jgi:hypothetical protein
MRPPLLRVVGCARRLERALCASFGIRCQYDRTLEKGCSRGKAAASLRAAGRGVQLGRDRLVGPGGGVGAVPHAPILVVAPRDRLGKRGMHPPALSRRRQPVDGGADERMAEAHMVIHSDQLFGVGQRLMTVQVHAIGGLEEKRGIADRIGGREQEQLLRARGRPFHPASKGLLDAR